MNYKIPIIFFASLLFFPAFGQETSLNESLSMAKFDINWNDFNVPSRDATIIPFDEIHDVSWQVNLVNELLYGNPDGNAVIRVYSAESVEKFFEIGMGSHPRLSYWVAAQVPETGYALLHQSYEKGWAPGKATKLTYSEQSGLTVDNGLRTVMSNLDISPFTIKSYSVHGMEGSTDPPATTSGTYTVKIISADYGENPLSMFPFIVTGALGVGVIILIISKKRS